MNEEIVQALLRVKRAAAGTAPPVSCRVVGWYGNAPGIRFRSNGFRLALFPEY